MRKASLLFGIGVVCLATCPTASLRGIAEAAAGGGNVWLSDSVVVRASDAAALDTLASRLAVSCKEQVAFDSLDAVPAVLTEATPVYPNKAKSKKLEADVWVQALVGKDGKVRMARILKTNINQKTAMMGFERSALTAAMQMIYKPAARGSSPIQAWVSYAVAFRLQ
jgi:TonB family protein